MWNLIAGLTDDELEDLILELVEPAHPSAVKLTAPYDYGLDVLVPARDGMRAIGWQAKNYGKRIYWPQCTDSVRRAAAHWDPISITFAFPRPLTTSEIEDWEDFRRDMLTKHPRLERLEWCHSLARQLRDRQDVVERMLRELLPGTDLDNLLDRLGGDAPKPQLDDMLEAAIQQAEREAALDEAFDAQIVRGPSQSHDKGSEGYSVELDYLRRPVLSFTWDDGDRRAKVTAVPKPDRDDNRVRPWFAENSEGMAALELARRALAHGRAVTFRGDHVGVQLDRAPAFFDELSQERDLIGGQLDIEVSDSVPVTLTIVDGEDEHSLTVEAVLAPAMPGYRHALVGLHAGLMVTLDWLPGDQGRSELATQISPLGVPAAELLGGLRFGQRFPGADLIRIDAPQVFDQPILDRGATGAADTGVTLEMAIELAQVAARLELLTGRTLSLSDAFDTADIYTARLLDAVLDGDHEQRVESEDLLLLPAGSPTSVEAYAGEETRVPVVLFGHSTGLELEWRFEGGRVTDVFERADGVGVEVTAAGGGPVRASCGLRVAEGPPRET